jgi:hypothetical protein
MHVNRHHLCRSLIKLPALIVILAMSLSNCTVYTIDKSHLENKLNPRQQANCCKAPGGLNKLLAMSKAQYNNHVDTVICLDGIGSKKVKRLTYDSKITVITTDNKAIRFYAKTLYIWKDEFLIGERTALSLRSPNYFPVKLKDILRIEVKG